jgi:hypothetical protein
VKESGATFVGVGRDDFDSTLFEARSDLVVRPCQRSCLGTCRLFVLVTSAAVTCGTGVEAPARLGGVAG